MTNALLSSSNLTPIQRAAFVAMHKQKRELLLQEFPELLEDQQALDDTLEGISYLPDIIANIIRDAREDETTVTVLAMMIREMSDRKARFAVRAERRRSMAQHLMEAIDLRKLEQPDFTASIRAVPPKVEIEDDMIPDVLCKFVRVPDKTAIKAALAEGPVAGARMSNGGETLSIRTK